MTVDAPLVNAAPPATPHPMHTSGRGMCSWQLSSPDVPEPGLGRNSGHGPGMRSESSGHMSDI